MAPDPIDQAATADDQTYLARLWRTVPIAQLAIVDDINEFRLLHHGDQAEFLRVMRHLTDIGFFRGGAPLRTLAHIDLAAYRNFDDYRAAVKRHHKGTPIRDYRRATDCGYVSKFFNPKTYVGEIYAVQNSMPTRQGRPITDNLRRSVEERGGYAETYLPPVQPTQAFVWNRHFGTFRPKPGHKQGLVVVDEELAAYIYLRRVSEFCWYEQILGHCDHLANGVMNKTHLELIKHIYTEKEKIAAGAPEADHSVAGLRYVAYAGYFLQDIGLVRWKRKLLFRPGQFASDFLALAGDDGTAEIAGKA
jgi:hypothetical protein